MREQSHTNQHDNMRFLIANDRSLCRLISSLQLPFPPSCGCASLPLQMLLLASFRTAERTTSPALDPKLALLRDHWNPLFKALPHMPAWAAWRHHL